MNAPLPLFEYQAKTPADKRRAEVLAEKAAEDDILVRQWKEWRREEVTNALAGPHGARLANLIAELKVATSWDAIDTKKLLSSWQSADHKTQALARRVVNAFIVNLREKAGLPPFDDPVPVFETGKSEGPL